MPSQINKKDIVIKLHPLWPKKQEYVAVHKGKALVLSKLTPAQKKVVDKAVEMEAAEFTKAEAAAAAEPSPQGHHFEVVIRTLTPTLKKEKTPEPQLEDKTSGLRRLPKKHNPAACRNWRQ